jgi:hypothetical protein
MWGKAAADMSKQRYVRVDLGELALAYDCVWGSMSQIVACVSKDFTIAATSVISAIHV